MDARKYDMRIRERWALRKNNRWRQHILAYIRYIVNMDW